MPNKIKTISYEQRAAFFWFIVGVSVISLFVYFYAINSMARNTALRSNLEHYVADARDRIGTLEFAYIEAKNAITTDLAYSMGFKENRAPLYVSKNSSTALTLNR